MDAVKYLKEYERMCRSYGHGCNKCGINKMRNGGLKDKNGNRIWENDIVSIITYSYMEPEEDYFGKVVYAEGYACWCIQQPDDESPVPLYECEGSYQTDRFVEGNVFDNPELSKGE